MLGTIPTSGTRRGVYASAGIVLFVGLIALTLPLGAQSAAPQRLQLMAQRVEGQEALVLGPVVVTATRLSRPLREASTSISVIDRQEIEDRMIPDTLELLRETPGINMVQTGARGGQANMFIRGGENDQALVLIDGVKVNLGGGTFSFSDVLAVNLERIEVLRGPQSALYGADAMTGVVHYISRRGKGPPRLTIRSLAGSQNTFEETVEFEFGDDRFGLSFGLGRLDTDNFLPVNHENRNTTVSLRLDGKPSDDLELSLTVRRIDSRFEIPTESAGDLFDPLDPNQHQEAKRTAVSLEAVVQGKPWWRHVLHVEVFNKDRSFSDEFDAGIDFGFTASTTIQQRLRGDYASFITLPTPKPINATLTLGLAAERERFHQQSRSGSPGSPPSLRTIDENRHDLGAYGQIELSWKSHAFLTLGARYDDHSTFGSDVNPRATGALILPRLRTKLRAAYGTGIKAPTFVENFGFGNPNFTGNATLEPEMSKSFEVGFDQPIWNDRLMLSATYFQNEFDDLIAFVGGATPPEPNWLNIQAARSRGVELELKARLPLGFSARAAYTFLDTEVLDAGGLGNVNFIEGEELVRRPRNVGSVSLSYRNRRLHAMVNTTIVGETDDVDFSGGFPGRRATLANYTKVDLSASFEVWRQQTSNRALRIVGRAENLLDENFEQVFGFSSSGAVFLVGLEGRF